MKINLTKEEKKYIAHEISSGRYTNSDELLKDALLTHRILKDIQKEDLKSKIKEGWSGQDSKINIGVIIKSKLKK